MKQIITIITLLLLFSCSNPKYKHIEQEIINGKISAKENGIRGGTYLPTHLPKIWIQNATQTKEVKIPFEYEGRWKVGDSCLLIIEKYEVIK